MFSLSDFAEPGDRITKFATGERYDVPEPEGEGTITVSKYGPVSLPVSAAEALETLEAGLTDENDCSYFDMSFMGGPDAVTVEVSADDMRHILSYLADPERD